MQHPLCGYAKCKYWDTAFVSSLKPGRRVVSLVANKTKLMDRSSISPKIIWDWTSTISNNKATLASNGRVFMHKNMFKFAKRKPGVSQRNIIAVWLVVQIYFGHVFKSIKDQSRFCLEYQLVVLKIHKIFFQTMKLRQLKLKYVSSHAS